MSLIKNKALKRQYHTFFDWDGSNANQFFSMLGEDFRKEATGDVRNDTIIGEGIKAFIEVGRLRNELVHRNFGIYTIDKTANEVLELYNKALSFINFLSQKLESK